MREKWDIHQQRNETIKSSRRKLMASSINEKLMYGISWKQNQIEISNESDTILVNISNSKL